MLLETYSYTARWDKALSGALDSKNTLVIVFASSKVELIKKPLLELSAAFHSSIIIGASTAGEIYQDELYEDSLGAAVLKFEKTELRNSICTLISAENSYDDGVNIVKDLYNDNLQGIFILFDGLNANGSKLTEGLSAIIPKNIPITTDGLIGDGGRFEQTWVLVDHKPMSGFVCAVGLYGEKVHIAHALKGGWDRLGIERIVTILYELHKQPALEIYKRYLGEKAEDLPVTGLLFPLEIKDNADILFQNY